MSKTAATILASVVCLILIIAYVALRVIYGISGFIPSIIFFVLLSLAWGGIKSMAKADEKPNKEEEKENE